MTVPTDVASMAGTGIYARESSYLESYVQIGMAGERLISVDFPDEPDAEATPDHGLLDRIFAYLEGVNDDFADVEIGLTVSTEHRAVLETVREIPYGEQVTVEAVVRMTPQVEGDEGEATVRSALADNPLPLVVPDHRVRDGPSGAPPEIEQRLRSLEGL
ncbi:MAG: MGMT family protein [Halanaeroarchaeum sp.]